MDDALADLLAGPGLAIVTCRDSRLDPLAVFGLEPGDAKILRHAGARVTDDGLRSLTLPVAEVTGRTDVTFEPLRDDVANVLESPLIAGGTMVAGLVYDLPSGRLTTVVPPCNR